MINELNNLLSKTRTIQRAIDELYFETNVLKNSTYTTFKTNFLNFSTTSKQTAFLNKVKYFKNRRLFFEHQITINTPSSQLISISLLINKIAVCVHKENFSAGQHVVNINKTYTPTITGDVEISLQIESLDGKYVLIKDSVLTIFGLTENASNSKFQHLKINNNILISCLFNGNLYYKIVPCDSYIYSLDELSCYGQAKDYSFCLNNMNDSLYLFRVDNNSNLFYTKFDTIDEKFITKKVDKITTCFSNELICACILKKGKCYSFELIDEIISGLNEVVNFNKAIVDCYLYFNNYNLKTYLILSDSQKKNYILESISETNRNSENIFLTCNIFISTYKGEENVSIS